MADLRRFDLGVRSVLFQEGQYEKAAEITRQALRESPPDRGGYADLANCALALQRLDETRKLIHDAQALKGGGDDYPLHESLYALAGDSAGMAEEQKWFASRPQFENFGLALASDTEAYAGHLGNARELTRQAVESALRVDDRENGAIWEAIGAQREAAYGKLYRGAANGDTGPQAFSHQSGSGKRNGTGVCFGGRHCGSAVPGTRPGKALPAGYANAVSVASGDSGADRAGQQESGCCFDSFAT